MSAKDKRKRIDEKVAKGKDMAYYLTQFKIEGHSTWRVHVCGHATGFAESVEPNTKVTEKIVTRIDRVTGEHTRV